MIKSLSFKADPPSLFHTYSYHCKKAIKEGFLDDQPYHEDHSEIIRQVIAGMTELFEIPADFHIVLLKDNSTLRETIACFEHGRIIHDVDPLTGGKFHPDKTNGNLDFNALSFLHLDISLSSPTDPMDYNKVQSFSFETRYGFGMDQDLVVWIIREDLLDIIIEKFSGLYMEFDDNIPNTNKCYVQNDLAIQGIYILGKIIMDFLNRGIKIIRNEIRYKSIILHNSISDNPDLDPLIKDPRMQSENILCASTEFPKDKIFEFMSRNRIEFDVIERSGTESILRFANYPVHSKEQMEYLVDIICRF